MSAELLFLACVTGLLVPAPAAGPLTVDLVPGRNVIELDIKTR